MARSNPRQAAARRRLEQQLSERARRQNEARAQRRRTVLIVAAVTVVVGGVVAGVLAASGGSAKHPAATASPSATATFTARKTSGPCGYTTLDASADPSLRDVGLPPDPAPTPRKTLTVDFHTNRGLVVATLDGQSAPCNVQSIAYLIGKKFYDDTPCPRVDDTAIFIVQCGSGGATTAVGPTYTSPDENLADADYTAGTIAMATSGQPHTGNSQFFFITKDSNSGLAKSYTVIGHVTQGLSILQNVAAGGNNGSAGSAGGGAPTLSLTFTTVRIVAVSGGGPTPGTGPTPTLVPTTTVP